MKKFFYLLLLSLSIGLIACSGDDQEEGAVSIEAQKLIGLWEVIHIEGVTYDDDGQRIEFNMDVDDSSECLARLEELDVCDGVFRFEFQKDNVFNAYLLKNDEFVKDGKSTDYSVNDDILTLGYGTSKDVLTIKRLTSSELVLYDYDNDSNYEDSFTITMKRIK